MIKLLKNIILPAVLLSLVLTGCDDLFSKGDTEKAYDGPDVVAFKPLESTADEGSSVTIEVQLISQDGLATSDVAVSFSVDDGESTAEAQHYSLSSNSVTIASGSASATFSVDLPADSGLDSGDEVVLVLDISGGDVEAAEELDTTTIFIQGVDD